ncbi:MAG TPA: fumarate hydratase [Porphyromonadaceae bacterium]|jgi:fumarate hydratase subunit alpha|uniref:fumarate hydratase n=1 Tax=Petrimonas sp. TaxID=2023866 RepID=UPI000EDDD9E8|nr:fumarate hydratase [Porphyromonadaceae bacterium]HMM18409.1 fumarate hydratase [Petrimonas sp.]
MTRNISASAITRLVEQLCIEACCVLAGDINNKLKSCLQTETSPLGKEILGTLIENARVAREESSPMCQDTGMTVVFVRMGQNVQVTGGFIEDAINQGVRQGYEKGYLRKSVVKDPLHRENTRDNTPAVIHYEIVPGDVFHITVSPKGFGSENKSALKMLTPSEGVEGVKRFVLETVSAAGGNPCPPIIVGVGIGGTMERAAYLSKKALLRPLDTQNPDSALAALEAELLSEINKMGIGPAGFGGTTTALGVNILTYATHIAGLPVSVNIGCHATRHAEGSL